ncbi:hypothetical protein HETIRDRAFT_326183 [Heterobasidion irregulare TC 32-1]|uniref:Uncharacterized protein n=1 Tax=Heterobasidion irregulare (strain TC 32-1) TaxID=747525 RepID=W4JWB9_HETIT|nr:uncharacterized protein HETIRDRAFT_326183 [Heterobasidion irregulare TC 32-1]ETW77853.1 hypothetical protein HETIRDRAFT_326183 [Heterobasidion irregulare TC 32-1]
MSNPGAILAGRLDSNQGSAIFWTATTIAVMVSLVQGAITTLTDICEGEGLWTIRFNLGRFEHLWWTAIAMALVASLGSMITSFLAGNNNDSLGILLLATASSLTVFRYAWPAWRNRHYCRNRWFAWTGPSRTGIDPVLVPLIEGTNHWQSLAESAPIRNLQRAPQGSLLKSTTSPSEKQPIPVSTLASVTPSSLINGVGLYAPVVPSQAASLLWGSHLGFAPRVSRGILGVPQRLLTSHPLTESGHNGQAMCLAHGILGRNKGLEPMRFILRLDIGKLEEKSVQWPRPSKVLRSYYKKEMDAAYGGLGINYVNAATELALLLADSSQGLIEDWLLARMEHQDYELNREACRLGAPDDDLRLLYLLSYGAMLVSLSAHNIGHRFRPEITLFVTYWQTHKADPLPQWVMSEAMQSRIHQEHAGLDVGTDLDGLVLAVIPPIS